MAEIYGRFTGVRLDDPSPLLLEGSADCFTLSRQAACLAMEIAATSFVFNIDEWLNTGWCDLIAVNGAKIGFPPDAGKILLLLHPLRDGRFLIAVAFRGTGEGLRNWAPNIACGSREGFHAGFLDLAKTFEKIAGQIEFPAAAAALSMERLTLRDALREAGSENSRFRFFAVGYSQGSAVMQCWLWRRILDGVAAQNIRGLGFASPAAAYPSLPGDPRNCPIVHIVNSDDLTPRIGAAIHLGRRLLARADDAMRKSCYAFSWEKPGFQEILRALSDIRDTSDAYRAGIALMQAIESLPKDQAEEATIRLLSHFMPESILRLASGRTGIGIRFLVRHFEKSDPPIDRSKASSVGGSELRDHILARMASMGAGAFSDCLWEALAAPHMLIRDLNEGEGPYSHIILKRFESLEPMA